MRAQWLYTLLLLSLVSTAAPLPQTNATFKVGAWGDDASRNNLGVQVQIETHLYDSLPGTLQYFWVGDDLGDGAFIQFGYALEPGIYCLKGASIGGEFTCSGPTDLIQSDDARWQWQYWPNRFKSDYYYEIGAAGSAGSNETWHVYTIMPTNANSWRFVLDGRTISNSSFVVSHSADAAFIIAEGNAGQNVSTTLGPVRFSHLSYFDGKNWNLVNSLVALSYCGTGVACFVNSYGATAIGPNQLLVGSNVPRAQDGLLLWTSGYVDLDVVVHPGTQFFVTSVLGTNHYNGSAIIGIPKGMFAYVALSDRVASTPGAAGLIGGQDHFQEWSGAVNSKNLTVQVLMDSNKRIVAIWETDETIPWIVIGFALITVAAYLTAAIRRRLRESESNP